MSKSEYIDSGPTPFVIYKRDRDTFIISKCDLTTFINLKIYFSYKKLNLNYSMWPYCIHDS